MFVPMKWIYEFMKGTQFNIKLHMHVPWTCLFLVNIVLKVANVSN